MEALDISSDHCIVEREGHILMVTLDRPESGNALTAEMVLGLYHAWRLLDEDDTLYCAILTANGNTFCAGMDPVDPPAGAAGEAWRQIVAEVPDLLQQATLRDKRPCKPIILAAEGNTLDAGTEILLGTDIRIASEDALFGITDVARGHYPAGGSTVLLRRQIPYCVAAESLLCGEYMSAQRALECGLINRVVQPGETFTVARGMAHRICDNGPLAVKAVTRSLRDHQENLSAAEALKASDRLAGRVQASADALEGTEAQKARRQPRFRGR